LSIFSRPAGADAGGAIGPGGPQTSRVARSGVAGSPRDQSHQLGWALVAPAVAMLLAVTVFPAIYLLWASLRRFNLMMPDNAAFVGIANFQNIFANADIRHSMLVTILFVVAAVGIEFVLGLLLALTLAPKRRSNTVAATLLILPMAVTPVVSALVWRELFNPNYGWVNYYLHQIGITQEPIAWLSNPNTAWFAIISLDAWQWTPFVALILMAGLQGIPPEPREAAAVDGAQGWRLFWDVTFPLLRPFVAIAVLLRTLEAFKTFGTIRVLTGGGPGVSTEIINLTIYRTALQDFSVGAASALGIAFLLFLSILVPQMLRALARNSDLVEA
jgi:multiple sugar transport system permease protein